ncbi:MAG: NEW3 domain-containing protein, partial [Spirochaetota bacterium]
MEIRAGSSIVLALALLCAGLPAATEAKSGDSSDLAIRASEDRTIEAAPRSVKTVVFKVSNNGATTLELQPEALLPEGWRLSQPLFPFELGPGESDTVFIGFIVPQAALSGPYEVKCRVSSGKAASEWARVSVKVPLVLGLDLRLLSAPRSALAGEDYRAVFVVANLGNAAQRASLAVDSGSDFPVSGAEPALSLKPGESRELPLVVHVPKELRQPVAHHLRVSVALVDNPEIKSEARSAVDLIPLSPAGDTWHRLPVTLGAASSYGRSEGESFSNSLTLSGRGTLDEDAKNSLAFSLAPPIFPDPSWSEATSSTIAAGAYYVGYWNDLFEAHVGDRSYGASPLTSGDQGGRGAEGDLHLGTFDLKAFYADTGRVNYTKAATASSLAEVAAVPALVAGGSARLRFGEVHFLGLNLFRSDRDAGGLLVGGNGFLRPYDTANIAFEAALGTGKGEDYAWSLQCDERE